MIRMEKNTNCFSILWNEKKIFSCRKKTKEKNINELENSYFYILLDYLLNRDINKEFNIDFSDEKNICYTDLWKEIVNLLPHKDVYSINESGDRIPDLILMSGMRFSEENKKAVYLSQQYNIPLVIYEDGFLRSASTYLKRNIDEKYWRGIAFLMDSEGVYFDATRTNKLEKMLNDKSLIITEKDKKRAQRCIKYIIENHLTKYNHQPIYTPSIGRKNTKKVLVVDQSYGDMSISKGLANNNTFKHMLETAVKENPDADIIVKTHPDTISGRGGYFTSLKPHDNIYTQTSAINPISLIQYVDSVYVCTTQLGFEALLCGKEVNVFGLPFYAGWGVTKDHISCNRRINRRTIEEIFFITYILYTHYYNPLTGKRCEIEEALEYLLKLREEFFAYETNNKEK